MNGKAKHTWLKVRECQEESTKAMGKLIGKVRGKGREGRGGEERGRVGIVAKGKGVVEEGGGGWDGDEGRKDEEGGFLEDKAWATKWNSVRHIKSASMWS